MIDVDRLERAIWAYLKSPWYIDIDKDRPPKDIRELATDLAGLYETDDPAHQVANWEVTPQPRS